MSPQDYFYVFSYVIDFCVCERMKVGNHPLQHFAKITTPYSSYYDYLTCFIILASLFVHFYLYIFGLFLIWLLVHGKPHEYM